MDNSVEVTKLLRQWSEGDETALDDLLPFVYGELRKLAKRQMNRQSPGHTMQTTELIHEAYIKLGAQSGKEWKSRSHFYAVAAKAMRHILVDYARAKSSKKRGGMLNKVTLADNGIIADRSAEDMVELDEVLDRLGKLDERKVSVVEMKFFGGLKISEIADVLLVSEETVKRDWRFARSWLLNELSV